MRRYGFKLSVVAILLAGAACLAITYPLDYGVRFYPEHTHTLPDRGIGQ